ncbi:MAG: hypothetical protein JNK79_11175, partial [Chitinophagaceae bacterium]|nr:hypothetical protein [Chitinophagaceae bacterium]
QLFAFADSVVRPEDGKNDYLMYAFLEKDTATKKSSSSLPTVQRKPKRPEDEDRVLRYQTNNDGASFDLLQNFEFDFTPEPIAKFDSTRVVLTDTNYRPVRGYSFKRDTSNKKIAVVYPWTENTSYKILIDTLFAEDTSGRRLLKNDTISFTTRRNAEYGLVRIRFLGLSLADNPVLQFIQGEDVKYSHTFTNNTFYARLFRPGEYELRIVSDRNKNGVWDTGQFFGEHRQPEKVRRVTRKVNVKANWDNEIDIQL